MDNAVRISHSGSEKRQRTQLVQVRCTDAEYAQLRVAAERTGLTLGGFMRQQCLGTAGPRAARRPPVERETLSQLLALLGRAASNLNQIGRIGNTTGELPSDHHHAVAAVKSAADEILLAFGRSPA